MISIRDQGDYEKHARGLEAEMGHTKEWLRGHYNRVHDLCINDESRLYVDSAVALGTVDFWFAGDTELWFEFAEWVQDKRCLDIGSGPISNACHFPFIKDWHVIDPLVDRYQAMILEMHGRTLWRPEIVTYNQNAEVVIEDLIGTVDGLVYCRNCLDHTVDPMGILDRMALYAAPGAYLMVWNDLYHGSGCEELDNGHYVITEDPLVFKEEIRKRGFEIIREVPRVRGPGPVEYGCVAKKS